MEGETLAFDLPAAGSTFAASANTPARKRAPRRWKQLLPVWIRTPTTYCWPIGRTISTSTGSTPSISCSPAYPWRAGAHSPAGQRPLRAQPRLVPRYAGGLTKLGETHLVVSRGLSYNPRLPRVFNPPEVVIVDVAGTAHDADIGLFTRRGGFCVENRALFNGFAFDNAHRVC